MANAKRQWVKPQSRPNSDINVTPLVDVVLVLLIIFMVLTPLLEKDIEVRVPETEVENTPPDTNDQLVVQLTETGAIKINAEAMGGQEEYVNRLKRILAAKRPGDVVVLSVHWGSNWGHEIAPAEVSFAHRVIDHAGVDVFHGHSSHHPKAIEVYAGKLILYGCGDFINDYEGIHGHEAFRGDLSFMYFPALEANTGRLRRLELVATQMHRFRVRRASAEDRGWLCSVIDREGQRFGTRTQLLPDQRIELRWPAEDSVADPSPRPETE